MNNMVRNRLRDIAHDNRNLLPDVHCDAPMPPCKPPKEVGALWVVHQLKGEYRTPDNGGSVIEFQGVFSTERMAIGACRDHTYCIAPVYLNEELPHNSFVMKGAYYPLYGTGCSTTCRNHVTHPCEKCGRWWRK